MFDPTWIRLLTLLTLRHQCNDATGTVVISITLFSILVKYPLQIRSIDNYYYFINFLKTKIFPDAWIEAPDRVGWGPPRHRHRHEKGHHRA